jgi:pyridoxal phosphate enzyme (YggS family)
VSTELDAQLVAERIAAVQHHLASLSPQKSVGIVAVTKGFGVEAPRAALAAGLTMVGENYAQELVAKHEELTPQEREQIQWHFLGRLQQNKVRSLAPIVSVWQSVDRVELIEEIAKRSAGASIMIQLNLSNEPQKGGAAMSDCRSLVRSAQERGLVVVGLMGVGAADDPSNSRAGFRQLVELAEELGLPERSIGMSDDLDLAVAEGSTMVRVGTALFGPRGPRISG